MVSSFLPRKTLAPDVKDRSVVKYTVQGAQERVVLVEVLPPERGVLVAGKDQIKSPLLVVAAVNQVKEQTGVLLVKLAMPNFINNQAGRADERGQGAGLLAEPPGVGKLVAQLRCLNEVGLQPVLAAFIAESHGEMGLPRAGRTDESEVLVAVDSCKGREAP